MKLKLLALLLAPAIAFAEPTFTTTHTEGGDAKVNTFIRLHSWHHYHLRNETEINQIYQMQMVLCPADKPHECERFNTQLGLAPGQEINYDRHLTRDVIYKNTGEHSVNASTSINGIVSSADQKYIWIHY